MAETLAVVSLGELRGHICAAGECVRGVVLGLRILMHARDEAPSRWRIGGCELVSYVGSRHAYPPFGIETEPHGTFEILENQRNLLNAFRLR
jgi:hypothetical protein